MTYVPISNDKVVDVSIVFFVFAALIGGYRFSIPLAILWSAVTYLNVDPAYFKWSLLEMIGVRIIFAVALVFSYNLAKRLHKRSPLNVYRAIVFGTAAKALVGLPLEIFHRGVAHGSLLRLEIFILETALCSVFMSLLIKHLRQVHLLNGVRKKGEKKDAN
jgi:hypothetical protein